MKLAIKIGGCEFKNPLWVASGTFSFAKEFKEFLNFANLGAIITKTLTLEPREGNLPPRLFETASGLLFSNGLQNPGVEKYLIDEVPYLKTLPTQIICSFGGKSLNEYAKCAELLSQSNFIKVVEVNLSCPNVDLGILPAQDKKLTRAIIQVVKNKLNAVIIAKLTPQVNNIGEIAQAAETAGADAVTIGNAFPGIAVDAEKFTFCLGNKFGGVAGPAIKPMVQHAVFKAKEKINIPIIGLGGIKKGIDVAEYLLLGASAVQIGVSNLINPTNYQIILNEFIDYLKRHNIQNLAALPRLN